MATITRIITRKFSTAKTLYSGHVGGAHNENAEKAVKLWRNVSLFVAIPAILLAMANAYIGHTSHHHERPEFVPYEYMRIRNKKFPWGDGNHTLFHNKHLNALPDGYED